MKPILLFIALFLSIAPGRAALVITEVMSSSAHSGGTNNADWFELTNNGSTPFSIAGWTWNDSDTSDTNTPFTGLTVIAAGQSIIITGEPAGTEASWISDWGLSGGIVLHQGSAFHNFSSGGDSIQIYNQDGLRELELVFGAAVAGFSLEWDQQGNFLGNSTVGRNGAAAAVSNGQTNNNGSGVDIGSPGLTLVPEPSAAIFSALAVVGCGLRRKRG